MDRFLKLGPFLLALPMVLYGVEHFIYARHVATIVPEWVPWRLYWAYFAGAALIAAGIAIVFKKYAPLAGTLLGTMIFLWLWMIHLFLILNRPGDAWAARPMFGDFAGRLINCAKDTGLSGAAFIFAGVQTATWGTPGREKVLALGRFLFGLSLATLGGLHFMYPAFTPGIPAMYRSFTFPVPGHLLWVYLTGAALLAAGVAILIRKESRTVAASLGIMILVFALLTYGPLFFSRPGEMWGNWLKDVGIAGGALILAQSLPKKKATD